MCGIAGTVLSSINSQVLDSMRETMHFRGPDGFGKYIDEHVSTTMNRLAIIDLDKGNQPFINAGRTVIVYQNGEIYNYKALKKTLEKRGYLFNTSCDTEVILHGYQDWSIRRLAKSLDGMFAIAIFDKTENCFYLVRDKFGEKPLFYTIDKDQKYVAYSSNIRSFKSLGVEFAINPESLHYYLTLHYVPGRKTIFEDIYRVLPGTYLKIDLNKKTVDEINYYKEDFEVSVDQSPEHLIELLDNSIQSRLVSDVPVGVFLSGGLDSSIIAALAKKHNSDIATFSIGFEEQKYDESCYSGLIAKHFNTQHHNFIFDTNCFFSYIADVVNYLDEPIGDQALLPTYWLAKKASEHIKVILTGEGADEIFGGYTYYRRFLTQVNPHNSLRDSSLYTMSGFPLVCSMNLASSLIDVPKELQTPKNDWEELLVSKVSKCKDASQKAMATDLLSWLPDDLLVKLDRMTMANSIEGRVPYLDPKIVEYGLNLPQNLRLTFNDSKVLLRMCGKLLDIPDSILKRNKRGFLLPMDSWIKQWFQDKDVNKYIHEIDFPFLNKSRLAMIIHSDAIIGNVRNSRFLFSLIILLEWYKAFYK